jgi:hypothetical protein
MKTNDAHIHRADGSMDYDYYDYIARTLRSHTQRTVLFYLIAQLRPVRRANAQSNLGKIGIRARIRQMLASIFRVALPYASLIMVTSAAADPPSVVEATGHDVFLPQAEVTLAAGALVQLTPLAEITANTDFRQYMQDGVPAGIRREALRKAWMLIPEIRNYKDPARDYAHD